MNNDPDIGLVILAGGQSRRMGQDKALIDFRGQPMIDHIIDRFRDKFDTIVLSAAHDYGTGLPHVPDNPNLPGGPVGGIFSLGQYFSKQQPALEGFVTVPVDAPFAPKNLAERLTAQNSCAVVKSKGQLHPTFAYWQCNIIAAVAQVHDRGGKAPSLHWLARQCNAQIVEWVDDQPFANINTPDDLIAFSK